VARFSVAGCTPYTPFPVNTPQFTSYVEGTPDDWRDTLYNTVNRLVTKHPVCTTFIRYADAPPPPPSWLIYELVDPLYVLRMAYQTHIYIYIVYYTVRLCGKINTHVLRGMCVPETYVLNYSTLVKMASWRSESFSVNKVEFFRTFNCK